MTDPSLKDGEAHIAQRNGDAMKSLSVLITLVLSLVFGFTAVAGHVYDGSKDATFLFVQSAKETSCNGNTLTLTGVPNTVYFSDRPFRTYGHISNAAFANNWKERISDGFKNDPPNAALAILETGETITIELIGIKKINGNSISYEIRSLSGRIPKTTGPASLFIDNFGPFPGN